MRIFCAIPRSFGPPDPRLRQDLGDHARPYRPAALPHREPLPLLQRYRRDQRPLDRHVVPRHHHLHPVRQLDVPRHVRRPKVKLRPVPREKRRVPSALFLRQNVHFRGELRVRVDRPRLRQHHPPLDLVLLHPPQQHPNVVPRLRLVQHLPEHLDPRRHRLLRRRPQPHDLHFLPQLQPPPLPPPRRHRPPPRDRENVLHAHQERLVHFPHRRRNVTVHRVHQLPNARRRRVPTPRHLRLGLHRLQRLQGTPLDHRDLVPRKLVLLQKIPDFHFHQLQQLRVVHHVHLVQKHHNVRYPHLPRQQYVLPRLRHRPVRPTHHQHRPVHLRRARDHVLDVVRMPRAVYVRVVPLLCLVLHVADRNRDPPLFLLRRIVDLVKPQRLRLPQTRQHPRDRRRQRRLPVIHVPDRPHVHVRLRPLKLRLRHRRPPFAS